MSELTYCETCDYTSLTFPTTQGAKGNPGSSGAAGTPGANGLDGQDGLDGFSVITSNTSSNTASTGGILALDSVAWQSVNFNQQGDHIIATINWESNNTGSAMVYLFLGSISTGPSIMGLSIPRGNREYLCEVTLINSDNSTPSATKVLSFVKIYSKTPFVSGIQVASNADVYAQFETNTRDYSSSYADSLILAVDQDANIVTEKHMSLLGGKI